MTQNTHNTGRRDFIRGASLLLTGTAAYTLTPNFAFAAGDDLLEDLAQVCYAMYPHKQVPHDYYRACAQGLLDKAKGDVALNKLLSEGVAQLNAAYPKPFREISADDQVLSLKQITSSPFFKTVRGHTVVGLYNIPEVWKYFGYQGPSFPHGGYLDRGFNDINWIK